MIVSKPSQSIDEQIDFNIYPYKSKEDKSIANALDSYGIPFFYKQPMLVVQDGKKMLEYTDFFLPTYNGLAIDYIVESNSAIYRRKKNVYQDNQIPAVFVTRKDMHKEVWQQKLYQKLEGIYRKRSVYH